MDFLVLIALNMSLGIILVVGWLFRWMPLVLLAGSGFFLLGVAVDSISNSVYAETGEETVCETPAGQEIFNTEHTISAAVASSEKNDIFYNVDADTGTERPNCTNCSDNRHAILVDSGSVLIGETVSSIKIKARLDAVGDSGTVNIEHRNSADAVLTTNTFNMNIFTTTASEQTITLANQFTLSAGDRIVIRNLQDTTNFFWLKFSSVSAFDGSLTRSQRYAAGAYSDHAGDLTGELALTLVASNVKDSNTATVWENNQDTESGAYIYVDLGSAKNLYGMKINHADTTKIVAEYAIAFSNTTTFTDISEIFTPTQTTGYQSHAFLNESVYRYMRLTPSDWGTASRMQISEIELWDGQTLASTEPETCTTTKSGEWQTNTVPFDPEFRVVSALGGSLMVLAAAIVFIRSD